jgi:hypothetical protein
MTPHDEWGTLPIGDTDTIRTVIERAKALFDMRDDLDFADKLHLFFMDALVPYFDCMWSGMDQTAAHIVYRLSDQIPPHIRSAIGVYPQAVRREHMFKVPGNTDREGWTTLEEWRREWEAHNPNIPPLHDLLPEGVTLQLGDGEPEPEQLPDGVIDVESE